MAHAKDFGAVGDGKADDTTELQHAINDGERLVVIPHGTYRITKPLVVERLKALSHISSFSSGSKFEDRK